MVVRTGDRLISDGSLQREKELTEKFRQLRLTVAVGMKLYHYYISINNNNVIRTIQHGVFKTNQIKLF